MSRRMASRHSGEHAESGGPAADAAEPPRNPSLRASGDAPSGVAALPPDEAHGASMAALIDRIRTFLMENNSSEVRIDLEQARRLLEATAGNVDLAVGFYCDDYFSSSSSSSLSSSAHRQPEEQPEEPVERVARSRGEVFQHLEAARRVRRRLEQQFEQDPVMMQDVPEEAVAAPVVVHMPQPQDDAAAPQPNPHAPREESVSVSDDEGAPVLGILRMVAAQIRGPPPMDQPNARHVSNGVLEPDSRVDLPDVAEADAPDVAENEDSAKCDNHEDSDDDYLSDNDWVLQEDNASLQPLHPPMAILWGAPHETVESLPRDNQEEQAPAANNVVAEDDVDEVQQPAGTGIPLTWLNTGFTASSCGTGLVTKPPQDEDVALFRWKQSQTAGGKHILPPPYHCRSLTALLSVVTAMLYSGARIQGNQVNCNVEQAPFGELSEDDRLREFDSRLVDALAALLLVASNASTERKIRALAKREARNKAPPSEEAADLIKLRKQTIRRKLRLCPICRWEEDATSGGSSLAEGRNANIRIATSYTNVQDLRSYVLSNIRAFTGRGGCALFLETIVRIHGKTCVEAMMQRARRENGTHEDSMVLISCSCEEQQKKLQQQQLQANRNTSIRELPDTTPPGHGCMSIEMLSLILTGHVYSSFKGWSSQGLGIGILSCETGEIGKSLMRPDKPVWILRGPTCHTVAWFEGSMEKSEVIAKRSTPGTVFRLSHWNCWYRQRNKSSFRVITARGKWNPPTLTKMKEADDPSQRMSITDLIMARRRGQQLNIVSSDEHGEYDSDASEPAISNEEIDRVVIHPDDMRLYPNKYSQWRFDMGKSLSNEEEDDVKLGPVGRRTETWSPYFRLNARQRLIVEMRLAPQINKIIWTRWPHAAIDSFTPVDAPEPIV